MDRYRSVDRYRGRAPYSGPLCGKITVQKRCEKIALWTAIGPWTAIGDGPLTGYFIYLLSGIHCQQTLYAPTIYRIQISAVGPSPHLNTFDVDGHRQASLHCPPGLRASNPQPIFCSKSSRWPKQALRPKCGECIIIFLTFFFFLSI